MSLAWSFLALACIGGEGPAPSRPMYPKSPTSFLARRLFETGDQKRSIRTVDSLPRSNPLLDEICQHICPDGLVEASALAALSFPAPPSGASRDEEANFCGNTSSTPYSAWRDHAQPLAASTPDDQEAWPMTLSEAIRIGLDNSEIARVISFGKAGIPIGSFTPIPGEVAEPDESKLPGRPGWTVIERLNADTSTYRFRAEVMAELRSIEQAYWNLAQAHTQLWAADRCVSLAREVVKREQDELQAGRGSRAGVAEAMTRLEQFERDIVTRKSDVSTSERQLRNLLGLPPADDRIILPVTPPVQARVEPDWDACVAEMLRSQPDLVQQQVLVRVAEIQLLLARSQPVPPLSLMALCQMNDLGQSLEPADAMMTGALIRSLEPLTTDALETCSASRATGEPHFLTSQDGYVLVMPAPMRSPLANCRQAQYILLRSRAREHQVRHQATHTLARFFLEIDASYKQFQAAHRLTKAAARRLEAQRSAYEQGRITVDRYIDAIVQYTTAIATEHQYRTQYSISLAALEEAKGTLLDYDHVAVSQRRRKPRKPAAPKAAVVAATAPKGTSDDGVVRASLAVGTTTAAVGSDAGRIAGSALPASGQPAPGRTWSFSLPIGGTIRIKIRGTITREENPGAPSGQ